MTVIRLDDCCKSPFCPHCAGSEERETELQCLVQVTVRGSRWSRYEIVAVEYADVGHLPDGTETDLRPDEFEQLHDEANDVRAKVESDIEEAELAKHGI